MTKKLSINVMSYRDLEQLIKDHYQVYFDITKSDRESQCYRFFNIQPSSLKVDTLALETWKDSSPKYSPLFNKKLAKVILTDLMFKGLVPSGPILLENNLGLS